MLTTLGVPVCLVTKISPGLLPSVVKSIASFTLYCAFGVVCILIPVILFVTFIWYVVSFPSYVTFIVFVVVLSFPNVTLVKSTVLPSVSVTFTLLSVSAFSSVSPFAFVIVIFPLLKSIVSPYPYCVFVGCVFIAIDCVGLLNDTFKFALNVCVFVPLVASESTYVTVNV